MVSHAEVELVDDTEPSRWHSLASWDSPQKGWFDEVFSFSAVERAHGKGDILLFNNGHHNHFPIVSAAYMGLKHPERPSCLFQEKCLRVWQRESSHHRGCAFGPYLVCTVFVMMLI